ncbi:hypothetical protein JHK86_024790 [Glycine max]|nr:hypothetical protein JHK86_024790 [Glycine max]
MVGERLVAKAISLEDAPALKRMAGRPRKAREKIHVERPSGTQEAKRSNTLRCSTCNEFAQNSWICQRAPVKKSKEKRLYRCVGRLLPIPSNCLPNLQYELAYGADSAAVAITTTDLVSKSVAIESLGQGDSLHVDIQYLDARWEVLVVLPLRDVLPKRSTCYAALMGL